MLQTKTLRDIILLSSPLALVMIAQTITHLIDSVFMAPFGSKPLAAIGTSSYLIYVAAAVFIGIGISTQIICAHKTGEKSPLSDINTVLISAIKLCILIYIPVSIACIAMSETLVTLFSSQESISILSKEYFCIRVIGLLAFAVTGCIRGFCNGQQNLNRFLIIYALTHILNILLSYVFIYGIQINEITLIPSYGPTGAALGSTISAYIGMIAQTILSTNRTLLNHHWNNKNSYITFKKVFTLSIPNSVQQVLFSSGLVILFAIVAKLGTNAMAASHILVNIMLLFVFTASAIGQATSSYVSKSLGQKNIKTAHKYSMHGILLSLLITSASSVCLLTYTNTVLPFFLTEKSTLTIAVIPFVLLTISTCFECFSSTLSQLIIGYGKSKTVMWSSSVTLWCFQLPMAYILSNTTLGLTGVWIAHLSSKLVLGIIYIYHWLKIQKQTSFTLY